MVGTFDNGELADRATELLDLRLSLLRVFVAGGAVGSTSKGPDRDVDLGFELVEGLRRISLLKSVGPLVFS